ncbi:MAG: phage integrase N-terminal SAM-like domain-containing protein [Myxococcaceae bacterium]
MLPTPGTTNHKEQAMGELYNKMAVDLKLKNLAAGTQKQYLRCCVDFAKYHGTSPNLLGVDELKEYLGHLLMNGAGPEVVKMNVAGLKFLYGVTLNRAVIADRLPWPNRRPVPQGPTDQPATEAIKASSIESALRRSSTAARAASFNGLLFHAARRSPLQGPGPEALRPARPSVASSSACRISAARWRSSRRPERSANYELLSRPPRRPGDPVVVLERAWERYHSNVEALVKEGVTEENRSKVVAAIRKHAQVIENLRENVA